MELQITGNISHILSEIVYQKTGFTKREFIIETAGEYPQHLKFEVHGEQKSANLERFNKVGQTVEVKFNLRGKLFTNKDGVETAYPSLVAWRIDRVDSNTEPEPETKEEEVDDLPF